MLVDPETGNLERLITLQYNPDSLSRTLAAQPVGGALGDRLQPLRLRGPAVETFKIEAEIDAVDQLEDPSQNPAAVAYGIAPQLATLEALVYPTSDDLQTSHQLAQQGVLEIAPYEAPLALFVWGPSRVVPVRIIDFSITEEAFDPALIDPSDLANPQTKDLAGMCESLLNLGNGIEGLRGSWWSPREVRVSRAIERWQRENANLPVTNPEEVQLRAQSREQVLSIDDLVAEIARLRKVT